MLSAFHYSQSGVYELQLKDRYSYRNAWATACFAIAVFSTLLLICTLLGLLIVHRISSLEASEDWSRLKLNAAFNHPYNQWILSGEFLTSIWLVNAGKSPSEFNVEIRNPARKCAHTWIFELSDRCRHRGQCTDEDLVYCRDRCERARSYCSVFGSRYSDDWSRLLEATWSATGRLSLIALYNSTSKCVMKQLSVTEDHRFVANRRILECPFDKRSEPTDIKVLVDEETKLMKWVAWTLTTSNHVTLFVAAPKQNLSISYPLKFPAAQLLDFVESKVSPTSARVTFGEEGSSNLWFVETAGVNENVRPRPKLPEDCEPVGLERVVRNNSSLILCRNVHRTSNHFFVLQMNDTMSPY